MRRLTPAALAYVLVAACGAPESASSAKAGGAPAAGAPVETAPPNARGQRPAFPGQTRAPALVSETAFEVRTVASGLDHPWGMAFLPDGRLLVSERPGRLRIVGRHGELSAPVAGLPEVDARGQGGLLGLALDPAFAANRLVYFAYAERRSGLTNTAVGRGRLAESTGAAPRLEAVQVIFRQTPAMDSTAHYGGRLVFGRDGTLFVTLGERSIRAGRVLSRRMDGTLGKMVRINPDGSIPRDNPFVGRPGARPEIFAIGHRNVQAAAIHPATGELWEVEHGARGGDELNLVRAGRDYGWPTISYGIEYAGGPIGEGRTQAPGLEQPLYYWDPVIAPSGMAFYTGEGFPAWKGSLFIGGLASQALVRLTLDGEKVTGEERLLTDLQVRIRDVAPSPQGTLLVVTDESDGRILELAPRP